MSDVKRIPFGMRVGYKMGITELNGKNKVLVSGAMQNISDNDFDFNQIITKGNLALHLKFLTYLLRLCHKTAC